MGLFDDLIPRRSTGGLFDDLIPQKRTQDTFTSPKFPEEEPAPRFAQERGLGVPEPVAAPVASRADATDDARAERGFGRSAYLDDGMTPNLPTNTPVRDITRTAQQSDDPFAGEGFGSLAERRGQQFAKGATEVVAAIPEASAISSAGVEQTQVDEAKELLARRAEQIIDLQSRLVDGMPERERAFIQQQISDLQIGQAELRKRATAEVVPASERDRFKIGDEIRQKSENVFGKPDPRDTSFWASVAEAGGNAAGFGVASLVPGGVAVGAGIGASLNKAQVYKEAIEAGADEETAQKASDFAMVFGASEIVPISRALKALPPRLRPKIGGVVMRKFADIAQASGEEAAQEYLQTVANNVVAQKLYDPDRGWTDGATEGALVGAVVGGILGGGVALATPNRPEPNDRERINSPRLTENDRKSPIPNDIIDDGKAAIDDLLSGKVPSGAVPMDTLYGKPVAPLDEAAPNVRTPTQEAVQLPLPTDRLSPTLGAPQEAGTLPQRPKTTVAPQAPVAATERAFEDVPEVDGETETGRTIRVYDDGQVEYIEQEQNAQAQEPVPQTQEPVAVSDVPADEGFKANVFLENEDLTSIEADPETFQYKSGGDAEGVTDRLLGVKKWETPRAGQAVVYEYADGRRVIADGHQRLGLAKRLRAEGQDVAMPVTIRREVDGYKPEDVMVEAALKNVAESDAKDPNPEAIIDAAKVLRARPNISPSDMNLPNGDKSALGRNALSLRNLSDEAFGMLVNDRASMRSALAVANAVSDKAAQANILSVVEKSGARNKFEAEMVARQAAADTVTQTQDSLFGSEDVTETLYLERARVMDQAIKRLRTEASAFKTILRNAGNIEGVGDNRVDRDASAQKAAEDAAAQEYITRLANSKGPISDALTEAARSIKAGGSTGQAVTGFVQAVRRGLQESGTTGQGKPDVGRNAQQVRGAEAGQVDGVQILARDAAAQLPPRDAAARSGSADTGSPAARNGNVQNDGAGLETDTAQGLDGLAPTTAQAADVPQVTPNTQRSAEPDLPAPDVATASKTLADARKAFNVLDQNKKIEDAQAYFAASSALSQARDGMADALAERGGRIELKSDKGLGAVITPRPDGKPGARITYFDGKGFSGDTSHDTLKAAVRDAIGQGYEIEAKGYLKNRQALWPKSKRVDVAETPAAQNTPAEGIKAAPNEGFVIRNKDTGEVVMETRDQAKVDALNTDKYEAVPVRQHLAELNDTNSKARKAADGRDTRTSGNVMEPLDTYDLPEGAELQLDDEQNPGTDVYVRVVDRDGKPLGPFRKFADDAIKAAVEQQRAKTTTERTEAGTQNVIPGAEQSTERSEKARDADRKREADVRAQQSKMRTGVPQDGPGGLFDTQGDMFDAPRQDATPTKPAPAQTGKIEDFGEKLEGAQKDKVKGWLDRAQEVADDEIVNVPLSKAWPEPDYQAMIDEGLDPEAVAFMHAARDEIPNKPRQKWKVERWADQVRLLREVTTDIASGKISMKTVNAKMPPKLLGFGGRVALYKRYGHEKSLKDFTLSAGSYSVFKGERFDQPRNIWTVQHKRNIVSHGTSETEAIEGFAEAHADLGNLNERTKGTKFEIRKWRGGPVFIGKKVGKDWIEVETNPDWDWKEARAYLAENQEALEAKFQKMKELPPERGEDNSPRVGVDHRNGQDVTPEMFSETFGFRGVQFGNYVEGPRRQADLNEAYDGLMDLAGIINVPPKAMSLNGTLGLAFGARGSGRKAKAHYEPDMVVINLTKGAGAGSLAHEWWHGLDHYFAMQGGKKGTLLTETGGRGLNENIRPEVVAEFQNLITAVRQAELKVRSQQADKRKSKPYFSKMEEMTARAFESYVIGKLQDQSASNDYLANILSEDAWNALEAMAGQEKPSWPYVTVSEMPAFREAFDKLFDTIQTEETADGTVRMFQRQPSAQDAATVEAGLPDLRKRLNQMMLKRVSLEAVEGATFQGAFEARGDDLRILVGQTQDGMKTVNHEAIHALRNLNLFTDAEWDALSDQAVAEWLDKYDIANRYDDLNAEAQIEEAIAEAFADFVAEQTEPGPIKSAFAKMRRMFRALKEWVTGNPSVQGVFEAVDSGRVGGRQSRGGTDTRALQKQINTATEAFKRWFGDSKVVDADGKPLVVYRGMSQDMQGDAFRVSDGGTFGEGIYLTSDPEYANIFADGEGGQVFPVYASIQNPAPQSLVETVEANATAQRRSSRAILEDMGYDGMIAEDGEIVAFRPEQIKSVYNRGTFDPNDARIRYQRQATARQKAQETFDQMPRDVAVPNRAVFDELFARNRSMFQNIGQAKGAVGDRMDVAREYMQDRILPLRRVQEAIEREIGQPIAEEMNAYVKEETYHGKVGRRLEDIRQFTLEPISDLIAESDSLDAGKVNDYLTALHAEERNARIAKINPEMPDGGSGMSNAEAQKILKDAKLSKDYAALKEIARLVAKLRDDTLQLRVDAGLMTAKDAAVLKAMYKNYVPLKGFEEFDGSGVLSDRPNVGRGYSVKGPETKRALGRKSRSFDVLANILSQAQEVAIRAEKNQVGKAVFDLASQYPSDNIWRVREVETKRVFNKQTGLVETRSEAPTARALAENEMAVKIDGKEYRIEFMDERMTRAMGAVKVGQMGDLVRILSLPARYFSAVNTMIDPEFVVRNAFRDMQAAQINIRNFGEADRNRIAKGMIANWPKAFAAAFKGQGANKPDTEWTKWYREFEEAGAKVSFWKMEDADRMKSDLERQIFLKRGNIAKRAGKFAITPSAWFSAQDNAVLGFIERTNLAVDNAVRLAAYVEARKSGWSKQKAASLSKNLTVNFNRRGHYGPVMNALYPFYNAGMQGTQVLFRAMSNPKRMSKYVVGMIGVGFISDLINAAISDEDDDGVLAYDKIQKFKQEMSFQISTGNDVLTVPLSYGYNVFPYMGQLAGQVYRGVKDPDEAFIDFVDAAVSAFSPVYESDAMRTMLPMVMDLPYDLATNSDWLHRPIRPENPYGDYGPDAYKHYGGASEWAKGVADFANRATGGTIAEPGMIDVSPEYLDHIWGFASGGAGRFISNTGDMAAKILSGKTDEVEGYRVPFARQVFSETGLFLDRDRYYRFREEVNEAAEARETAQEAGEPLSKLSYDLSKLKNEVKLADKVLRAIRKERAAVGGDATADQRKEWEAREAKAILRFNQKYVNIAGASIE